MDPKILASQKHEERLAAFWPRKVSRHITSVLVKTPMTANHATVLWGLISVANSYTVYLALTGTHIAIVLVPLIYLLCVVLDSVDGEIARFKSLVNPFGGKLLDGVCHRATEFSLLAAYAAAAYTKSESPLLVLALGLLLMSGDGMYIYVYERRLTMLRIQMGFKGHVKLTNATVYKRGTRFSALTAKQQIVTITGLFNYMSVYAMIALSFLPADVFLVGLGALAAFKHLKWMRLARRAIAEGAKFAARGAAEGTPGEADDQRTAVEPAPAGVS
ncbi:MAG: CDP-alcohol phosphatidyltransferase family protein [Chloroflexi bacterium]|nr:CDP-alcohol phosphatidyltransferase family protein [Chloroflexota bacterium]